jgi:transcriptional regulator with GAF, ATPase, and Fis domain
MQQTSPQAYLIIQLGNRWTDVLRLQRQTIGVGRSSDNQMVVRYERASRKHAQISPNSGGWSVRDLGSRNGTQVDGRTIDQEHVLRDGETIGVGGCQITFSYSLSGAFSASRQLPSGEGAAAIAQGTQELDSIPTIVNRRSHSNWSLSGDPIENSPRAADRWSFFYRLVFDLVQCDSPEGAAQVALERLLEQLRIGAGGVISIDSIPIEKNETGRGAAAASASGLPSVVSSAEAHTGRTHAQDAPTPLPPLAVLATRQAEGQSYHRVSDFLVRTMVDDRQAILARNVMDDSNLSLARQSARHDVVSIICAPLRVRDNAQEKLIGLLHVYSAGEERMLTDVDLDLAVGVADNLAIALSRQVATERLSQSLANSQRKIDQLREQLDERTEMIGRSAALQRVRQEIRRAAPTTATVLVRGESGVGKELVARAIHRHSPRCDGPLVCLNCAALAPTLLESELFGHEKGAFTGATERKIGKFEAAHDGTIFLDEIGEMPIELQAKFLRVLEGQAFERLGGHKPIQVNVRVIAATNRELEAAVSAKEFRADLYYRLRVIEIHVPPLRQRLDDVPALVEYFLNQLRGHAARRLTGIEPEALELLTRHSWPGNIRELRNVMERAIVLGGNSTLGVEDLKISSLGETPPQTTAAPQDDTTPAFEAVSLSELERRHILAMLDYCDGNKSKASQLLGIERSTLDRKLKRFDD